MKNIAIISVTIAIAIITPSCKNSQKGGTLKSGIDSMSYCYGLNIAKEVKGNESELNMDAFEKGLNDALSGSKTIMTQEQADSFLQAHITALQSIIAKKNKEKCVKFLEENKKRSGVKVTASGLQYEIIKEGAGPKPTDTDFVKMILKGTLIDGTEFSNEGNEPASFGVEMLLPGMKEGLQLMKTGSKYKFYIPCELAYGPKGGGIIKPYSTLIFDIELVSIDPKDKK